MTDEITESGKKLQKELNSGTSALVLLSVLARSREPMYGYQIAKLIDSRDRGIPMMKQGALYPVLSSLEAGGLLESTVDPSVSGPPRRYYHITPLGRRTLTEWGGIWRRTKNFVDGILEGGGHDRIG